MINLRTRFGILIELFAFMWERKMWWMMPMVVLLLAFVLLIVFAEGSVLAPFIYSLF